MKFWVVYPEEGWRQKWELFIALLLLYTCCATPYNIAFAPEVDTKETFWDYLDQEVIVDFFFFIDIVFNFFFAFYDSDYEMIDSKKEIARVYVKGWFSVDLLAIVPFDKLFAVQGYNGLARILRLPKIYKLIKITRLVRMLKIVKERNKLVKYLSEILKIGVGFERLLFFILLSLIICHIMACFWIFAGRIHQGDRTLAQFCENQQPNWICEKDFGDSSDVTLYFAAYYFTVTTITTVGYGDIAAYNTFERIICIILMITGVISFSFASGSLSSILSNYD